MSRAKSLFLVRLVLSSFVLLAVQGCNTKPPLRVEKAVATPTPTPEPSATPVAKLPPPTQAELESALHRIFGDNVTARLADRSTYIVGDFNGDQSEDLAFIVRPAPGKLDEVNSDFANWIIVDADKTFVPKPGQTVVIPPKQVPPKVASNEQVLAIVHGYGPRGWRNPDARQAYLVKHAAATFLGTAPSTEQKFLRQLGMQLKTDVIKESRNNQKGYLFWTGTLYAWHSDKG